MQCYFEKDPTVTVMDLFIMHTNLRSLNKQIEQNHFNENHAQIDVQLVDHAILAKLMDRSCEMSIETNVQIKFFKAEALDDKQSRRRAASFTQIVDPLKPSDKTINSNLPKELLELNTKNKKILEDRFTQKWKILDKFLNEFLEEKVKNMDAENFKNLNQLTHNQ